MAVSFKFIFSAPRKAYAIDGTGTVNDPFIITAASELAQLAAEVNGGDNKSGKYYKISDSVSSIDLSGYQSGTGWTPIGINASNAFRGNFDGNGKTITGLYINSTANYAGLFGYVYTGGVVKNIVIEADITAGTYVGGVTGYLNNGSVTDCAVSGTIFGSGRVGGVVGSVNVSSSGVIRCSFSGDVRGAGSGSAFDNIGGIAGYIAASKISQCFALGTVEGRNSVGGIVGHISSSASPSTVENCYYMGSVVGKDYVGGIAGDINMSNANNNNFTTNCYAAGKVQGERYVGGIAGYLYNGHVISCAALNQSVKATVASAGRVMGYKNAGELNNNIAFSGMENNGGRNFPIGQKSADGLNGLDSDATQINADGTLGSRFIAPVWFTAPGKLPDFTEPINMPAYLLPIPITAAMFSNIIFNGSEYEMEGIEAYYTGSEHTPPITLSGTDLNVTFNATYTNNINAGLAEITINGTGNYGDTLTVYFQILKAIPDFEEPSDLTAVYGQTLADVSLPNGWAWDDDISTPVGNAGLNSFFANFVPADTDNYWIVHLPFEINVTRAPVEKPTIKTGLIYDGSEQTGINYDAALLGLAYSLTAGTLTGIDKDNYEATFTLDSNYMWEDGSINPLTLYWTIAETIGFAKVLMSDFTYDGVSDGTPEIDDETKYGDWANVIYQYSTDDINWSENAPKNAGTYFIRAILTDSLSGDFADLTTESSTYTIFQKALSNELLAVDDTFVYNGSEHTPDADVSGALVFEVDYDVSYINNIHAGIATLIITGKGNYSGTLSVNFIIEPKAITVTPHEGQSKVFQDNDGILTYRATGLVGADSLSGTLARESGENAGEYKILIGTLENADYQITFTENIIFSIIKKNQSAPVLTILSKTGTNIAVKAVDGAEYKIGDGEWQSSNIFEGLIAGKEYTVYMRMAGNENLNASEIVSINIFTETRLDILQALSTQWYWLLAGLLIGSGIALLLWYSWLKNKLIKKAGD